MRTGQDPFNSAIQDALNLSRATREARRSGRWPAVDPNTLSATKSGQLRMAKKQALGSGQYFANNVIEKQMNKNRASVEGYFQRKSAIDNQG